MNTEQLVKIIALLMGIIGGIYMITNYKKIGKELDNYTFSFKNKFPENNIDQKKTSRFSKYLALSIGVFFVIVSILGLIALR